MPYIEMMCKSKNMEQCNDDCIWIPKIMHMVVVVHINVLRLTKGMFKSLSRRNKSELSLVIYDFSGNGCNKCIWHPNDYSIDDVNIVQWKVFVEQKMQVFWNRPR